MITRTTGEDIAQKTREFWMHQVNSVAFTALAAGKEIGHRIADRVDEETTSLLEEHYETKFEVDRTGRRRARSMGDIWLKSEGIYNPINVKAGEIGKNGQPNMVSLGKLLTALLTRQIDSYYLLIVKMRLAEPRDVRVYFVDMLKYLNFTTFDSGPGQIMLREREFYAAIERREAPSARTMREEIAKLSEMLEDADRRLFLNRQRRVAAIRKHLTDYDGLGGHVVDQGRLGLG